MPPKPPGYYTDKLFTCDDMDRAIQKEREECAKLCEKLVLEDDSFYGEFSGGKDCAKAIQARGQE